jgi:hypothetical protein
MLVPSHENLTDRLRDVNYRLVGMDGGSSDHLRDALAMLYAAIDLTYDGLLQDVQKLTEEQLEEEIQPRMDRVADGECAVDLSVDGIDILLDAMRLMRAVERLALQFERAIESDIGIDLEDCWRTSDSQYYVIPRFTPLNLVEGKPFRRRALLHYRIIPTSVRDHAIRLFRSQRELGSKELTRRTTSDERNFGAAFFPELTVGLSPGPGDFVVQSLSGFSAIDCLQNHIGTATAEHCSVIVWGELTMPSDSEIHLRQLLAKNDLDGTWPVDFVFAGSWHQQAGEGFRNVGAVLDGGGNPLFDVIKWAKFEFDGRHEGILPGHEIPILLCNGELSVMAICKDFLMQASETPYKSLNVDFAIVPSMSSSITCMKTVWGHADTAHAMKVRYGTRTLAVIQPALPDEKGVGQVLALPSDPQKDRDGTLVTGAWHTCPLK